ncbi:MAG: dTMP kinase [Spirochaetales bacterium]|nr:dTMP kinase [Spirochaetales bacterium]
MQKQYPVPNFFVLEGLDGAGTTTQLQLIARRAAEEQLPVSCTFEPTDNPVGRLIRQVLGKNIALSGATLSYLFAADRHEHVFGISGIMEILQQSSTVVCDRYLFSSLAYQSLSADIRHIAELNREFPLPETVFFLDTPVLVCESRRKNRVNEELFENQSVQEKVAAGYRQAFDLFAGSGMEILTIDGTLPPEKIHEKIWKRIGVMPIVKE